jgi:hypothetical protein
MMYNHCRLRSRVVLKNPAPDHYIVGSVSDMASFGCSAGSTVFCLCTLGQVLRLWACVVESSCGNKVVASGDGCSFFAVQTGGRKYSARWLCFGV